MHPACQTMCSVLRMQWCKRNAHMGPTFTGKLTLTEQSRMYICTCDKCCANYMVVYILLCVHDFSTSSLRLSQVSFFFAP